jgi:HK97 family phage portal protein
MPIGERPQSSGRYHKRALVPRDDVGAATPSTAVAAPGVAPMTTTGAAPTTAGIMYPTSSAPMPQPWAGWPVEWQVPPWGSEFSGYGYGRHNNPANVATAMTCVSLNSRQLGSFPVYGMRGEDRFTLPQWAENPEPEMYSSWVEMMHEAANSLYLRGEVFTYVTGRFHDGYPSRFVVVPADTVDVTFEDGRRRYEIDGREIARRDICHVKLQGMAGLLRGISPLQWVSRSIVTSGALETYASDLAARGGVPWAVITVPGYPTEDQVIEARGRWLAARFDSHGAPAMMSGGAKIESLTLSPRDMALLELREFDERRICAAFGVPAHLVNVAMADGMTYTNSTDLFEAHWRHELRTLADAIAKAWSLWLLPLGKRLEFNADRYTQPPLAERMSAYATGHGIQDGDGVRVITAAEIRSAERLGPGTPDETPEPAPAPLVAVDTAEADAQILTGAA